MDYLEVVTFSDNFHPSSMVDTSSKGSQSCLKDERRSVTFFVTLGGMPTMAIHVCLYPPRFLLEILAGYPPLIFGMDKTVTDVGCLTNADRQAEVIRMPMGNDYPFNMDDRQRV